MEGSGLGSDLNAIARPKGLAMTSASNAAELAARGAVVGAARGVIGAAASTVTGGSFSDNLLAAVQSGAVGGAYDGTVGQVVEDFAFENVTSSVAEKLGVKVVEPGDPDSFGSLAEEQPFNFRSVFQTAVYEGAIGGAVNGITDFPNRYIRGGVASFGRFDTKNLYQPFLRGIERRQGNLGRSAAMRIPLVRDLSARVRDLTD